MINKNQVDPKEEPSNPSKDSPNPDLQIDEGTDSERFEQNPYDYNITPNRDIYYPGFFNGEDESEAPYKPGRLRRKKTTKKKKEQE